MGTQWTAVVLVGASGPVIVAVLRDATGGYQASFVVLATLFMVSAGAVVASERGDTG